MRASSHDTERPQISTDALLARLGLNGSASDAEVEAAHQEVVDFLLRAPSSLRAWAERRLAEADEAYAILGGADRPDMPAIGDAVDLLDLPPAVPAPEPARQRRIGANRPPDGASTNGHRRRASMLGDALGGDEWYDAPLAPKPDPARQRDSRRAAAARPSSGSRVMSAPAGRFGLPVSRALVAGAALVGLVAMLVVGYNLGGGSTVPGLTGTPDPGATAGVDQAQVTAYMTRLAADAKDVEALQGLANLYFGVGDYATAGLWLDKLLTVEPDNITALLGNGAVAYNVGDLEAAESAWSRVAELDATNVEVHYDLGFLYLAQEPPNYDLVREEWQKVIELEPDGAFAETVSGHLDSLAPNASGTPSPSSSAAATPGPTPSAGS